MKTIKEKLAILGWSVYRFQKVSEIKKPMAYKIANGKAGQTSTKLAHIWLDAKIKELGL